MRFLLAALFLFLVTPALSLAGGGVTKTSETNITYTKMQTSTFDFEVFDYEQPTLVDDLGLDFTETSFVNMVGSISVTLMALVSEYALLSSLVLVVIAILAMIYVLSVVMNRRMEAQLRDINELADDREEFNQLVREADERRFSRRLARSRVGRIFGGVRDAYHIGGDIRRGGTRGFRRVRRD